MFQRAIEGIMGHQYHHNQEEMQMQNQREPCLVLTSDPKPRLRWTADLHERFVDAVTQLGGANSLSSPISFLSNL